MTVTGLDWRQVERELDRWFRDDLGWHMDRLGSSGDLLAAMEKDRDDCLRDPINLTELAKRLSE